MVPKILFVLRDRGGGYANGAPLPSGMSVSVDQLVDLLQDEGAVVKAVLVQDNNFIHQEVELFKPTHVIVEGFWVIPQKFALLQKMHPEVKFVVRCHSNTEFLASEGTVFGWALDYLDLGVTVAFNSLRAEREVVSLYWNRPKPYHGDWLIPKTVYLPNVYELQDLKSLPHHWLSKLWIQHSRVKQHGEFRVGCFGAIRPLKNHMNQALAALELARRMGLQLRFYVNAPSAGEHNPLLDSLRSLFKRMAPHQLVEVPWQDHDAFLKTLLGMDIVSQVSASETFNIVLADAVSVGVPVIGCNIPWLDEQYLADPLDVPGISRTMHHTWLRSGNDSVQQDQRRSLTMYVRRALGYWNRWLLSC